MEKGSQPPLTRKDRRQQERETQKAKLKAGQTTTPEKKITRREFAKAFTPGGWIPEAVRVAQGKQEGFSGAAVASAVKDAALAGGIPFIINLLSQEQKDSRPLKEKVLSFTWKDADNPEKLKKFVEDLADGYLKSTNTSRVKKEDLTGKDQTNFYYSKNNFVNAIKALAPQFTLTPNQWGYALYDSKKVFIDFESLKKQTSELGFDAGIPLLNALWHEWGHLDVERRTQGDWINNANAAYIYSPNSRKNEPYRYYRGGEVFTDTYFGFDRFEEVLNETVTARRMVDRVGLEKITSAQDYYKNGIDFFPIFTSAMNIPLDKLYQMHATSDFEGLAKLVGQQLPGNNTPIMKGKILFIGIQDNNSDLIRQTGALDVISKK